MSDEYTTTEATMLEKMVMCSGYSRTKTEDWARDEITRLRAENEKLREAVQLLISTQEEWERSVGKIIGKQPNVFPRAIDRARAALEGVTEPPR